VNMCSMCSLLTSATQNRSSSEGKIVQNEATKGTGRVSGHLQGPRGHSDLVASRANPAELQPLQSNACSEYRAQIGHGFHSSEPCATDRCYSPLKHVPQSGLPLNAPGANPTSSPPPEEENTAVASFKRASSRRTDGPHLRIFTAGPTSLNSAFPLLSLFTSLYPSKSLTPWSESASELYRPSDRRLSAK
jgi:hypothetical protein